MKRTSILQAALTLLLATSTASAQTAPLSGRIERTDGQGTCGAILLDDDLLLTAAHCLDTSLDTYVFRSAQIRDARALLTTYPHPIYFLTPKSTGRFRFDLAIAELAGPVTPAPPLSIGAPAEQGESLTMETWRRDTLMPGRKDCPVMQVEDGLIVMGCAVAHGHSGAPVVRFGSEGAELVAVVVGTLTFAGRPAALAVEVETPLAVLRSLSGRD